MKKTLSITIVVCMTLLIGAFTSCQPAQPIAPTPTPQTLAQKIVGKWTMKEAILNSTVQGDNRKDTTRFTTADYFEFKADGTIAIMETGKPYNGNWTITNNKLFITNTNYIDYSRGFDLPILTANNLQLYYTETNSLSTLEQKLNLSK
jgi:hypothetical protein